MMHEDWQARRTLTIAQMAATLQAGDRWREYAIDRDDADYYARLAVALFDAVDKAATPPADPRPPFVGGPSEEER